MRKVLGMIAVITLLRHVIKATGSVEDCSIARAMTALNEISLVYPRIENYEWVYTCTLV